MTSELFSVANKVVVITGGSRGIGGMLAQGFVDGGARTYITSRSADELQKTQTELAAVGDCIAIQSDLSTMDGVRDFVAAIAEREPRVDVLINNAGAAWGAPFAEFPEAGWDKIMDLNVKAIFFLTQGFLPLLQAAGTAEDPARVINIASINGLTYPGVPNYSYSASKAAVIQLTRHLAVDLAADNINVNGIAPGYFPSKMTAGLLSKFEDQLVERTPRKRVGQQEDIAGAAIYLASRAAAWVVGQTLVVDGGITVAS